MSSLLASVVIVAPMTAARIGKVGPAELLGALWCLLALIHYRHVRFAHRDLLFWVGFWAAMMCGTFIGIRVTPLQTNAPGLGVWAYLGLVALIAGAVASSIWSLPDLESFLRKVAVGATTVYGLLYLYSVTVSMTLLGLPLWYAGVRYSGGGHNPHQLALLLVFVLSIALRELTRRQVTLRYRTAWAVLCLAAGYMGFATRSSTLLVALVIVLVVLAFVMAQRHLGGRGAMAALAFGLAAATLFSPAGRAMLVSFIESDESGAGRLRLWSDLGSVLETSPFFGLGPGAHANGGQQEFHNSLLDIIALSGLVGGVLVLVYVASVVVRMWRSDPSLVPIACSLLAYGVAGFSFRRLVFWVGLVGLVSLADRAGRRRDEGPPDSETPRGRSATQHVPAGEMTPVSAQERSK